MSLLTFIEIYFLIEINCKERGKLNLTFLDLYIFAGKKVKISNKVKILRY